MADDESPMTHRTAAVAIIIASLFAAGCVSGPSSRSSGQGSTVRTAVRPAASGNATPTYSALSSLRVGDPAPILAGVRWVTGEPVRYWKPGRVYVLDFWATWCAPCIGGFPHMRDLQRQYAGRGVTVIGVAVSPQPRAMSVDEFMRSRQGDVGFTIAEDIEAFAHRSFLGAAGIAGIPTVMVIDGKGRLAWVGTGSPMPGLEDALARAVAESGSVGVAHSR